MDHKVWMYLAYLVVSIALTIWVATTLSRNGLVFLEDVFADNRLARAVNQLLVMGFYLLNLGFVAVAMRSGSRVPDAARALETLSYKIGFVLLVLGVLHVCNVFFLGRYRRGRLRQQQGMPPLPPAGRLPMYPPGGPRGPGGPGGAPGPGHSGAANLASGDLAAAGQTGAIPGAGHPGAGQPGAMRPGGGHAGAGQPGVMQPGGGHAGAGQPGAFQTGAFQPVGGQPVGGQPGATQPGPGQAGARQPGAGEPASGRRAGAGAGEWPGLTGPVPPPALA